MGGGGRGKNFSTLKSKKKRKKKKKRRRNYFVEKSLALMLKQMAVMIGLQAPASQGRADREYLFCTCA